MILNLDNDLGSVSVSESVPSVVSESVVSISVNGGSESVSGGTIMATIDSGGSGDMSSSVMGSVVSSIDSWGGMVDSGVRLSNVSDWGSNGYWGSDGYWGSMIGGNWGNSVRDSSVVNGSAVAVGLGNSNLSGVVGNWGSVVDNWGSMVNYGSGVSGGMVNNWGSMVDNWGGVGSSGDDRGGNSDGGSVVGGGSWGRWGGSGFVGVDGGTESSGISDVVDGTDATIDVGKSIRSYLDSGSSVFFAEGSTGGVLLIVAEGVAAKSIFGAGLD
jgi:hypothetical protein